MSTINVFLFENQESYEHDLKDWTIFSVLVLNAGKEKNKKAHSSFASL